MTEQQTSPERQRADAVGLALKVPGWLSESEAHLLYSLAHNATGDIVEIGSFVRSLSMMEAVIGLFYVAFIISKLVASFEERKA